jgi:rhamnulokinase
MPGTVLGPLLPSIAGGTGGGDIPVVAPACHDTGSAVAAVPADRDDFAYISSGTWSCVGVEVREPIISDAALAANVTNEGGVGGRFRLLRNVAGLWLLQECRRVWAAGGTTFSYEELAALAGQAPAFVSLIDPDDSSFLSPPDMPAAIAAFCRRSGQPEPSGVAATVRCTLESLALKYRWVIERIEEVQSKKVGVIHIMGGGARNRELCQFTANATGRRVLAGPAEATAAGNVIVQAMALGRVASLEEGRALIRRSFEVAVYEPSDVAAWDDAYARFLAYLTPETA